MSVISSKLGQTVEEATRRLFEQAGNGARCPCCNQFVKLYKRRLNSGMAVVLIHVYRYFCVADGWLHIPDFCKENKIGKSNDSALLRHWGLIEPMPGSRDDGSWRNGHYRLTVKGMNFVEGTVTVPEYVYLYNQILYGLSDGVKYPKADITIKEALRKRFDYDDLMKGG